MMGTGTGTSPARVQLLPMTHISNNTHAVFRCGSHCLFAPPRPLYTSSLWPKSTSRASPIAIRSSMPMRSLRHHAVPLATARPRSSRRALATVPRLCSASVPTLSRSTRHPGVVLDNVQVVNVTMNRTEPFDISRNACLAVADAAGAAVGFSQHVATAEAIIVNRFSRHQQHRAHFVVHHAPVNERSARCTRGRCSRAPRSPPAALVALDNSYVYEDNTLHVYRNGDNCYYGGGAALLLHEAVPLPNKSLVAQLGFRAQHVVAYDNARAAGAAVAYATNELFASLTRSTSAIDSTFAATSSSPMASRWSVAPLSRLPCTRWSWRSCSREGLAQRSSSPLPLRASFSSRASSAQLCRKSKGMCMGGALLVGGRVEAVSVAVHQQLARLPPGDGRRDLGDGL
jgi:hypothetical protein